jgi:hypothetical protein
MARIARTTGLKTVALVVALASLTINFGLIDLVDGFTGYVDQQRNQILDVGWGAVFGVILPLGLLAQLRRPERRVAGIQQTSVVAFALALAGVAGASWWYLLLAAGVAGASAVLLALHPARQMFLARGRRPEPVMLALAAVAAVPSLVYAWRMASAQRRAGESRRSAARSPLAPGRSRACLRQPQQRAARATRGRGQSSSGLS